MRGDIPVGLRELLDRVRNSLIEDDIVHRGLDALYEGLAAVRAGASPDAWAKICRDVRSHDFHRILLESPFAARAFQKPRGYAGDAGLIDLIYGCARPREATALGGCIYSWEFELPGFRSVRYRRVRLAREIDRVAAEHADAHVLAVAAGHLREVELSDAVRSRRVRLTAVDQDAASLSLVNHEYGACGVTTIVASILEVLRRPRRTRDLSLVYAAGLYDYLAPDLAVALTSSLFRSLRSGGRLLITNFTPAHHGAAFMEACMDWHLTYRDQRQALELTARIPENEMASLDQFDDPEGNITYVRIVRR